MPRIRFMNIEIDNFTLDEAILEIDRLICMKINAYVVTPNVDHIVRLEKGGEISNAYKNANLIFADGKPLIWISKLYKRPIKEKVSGSDLFPRICEMAANKGYTMFFLGAAEGVADKAAENLKKKYLGLNIVGTLSPPYDFEKDEKMIKYIIQTVKKAKPDILIVGLGCPKQELFMYRYCKVMDVPISLGLGASLDFEAGNIKRAPKWMSRHGMEWFYRFLMEPKRMFKRYFVDDFKIFGLIWKYR